MFKQVDARVDFPELERDLLRWWDENDIPRKYRERNSGADKRYSFIDGPITANNPMGVHHAWGRTYKDLFLRFRNMQGYRQRFQNGFDGQGLWIEVEVEKELGFKSKRDIEAYGIDKFVDLCKERVRRFSDVISSQSQRLAYWMDWDDSYHTMADENNYTIWQFLKRCHERGWLYEGRDVMPWCPRCGTGLSEHEIVTEGYKDIVHPGLYVKFPLVDEDASLLVWTTTPWTLTSNVAAAVHPEKTYVKARAGEDTLYLVKALLPLLRGEVETLAEMPGRELAGRRYGGPFDELAAQQGVEHRVIAWEDVSETEGTGIVHVAPGAGKEDFALGKEHGLATIAPLDEFGDFVEGFDWLTGMNVYDVNKPIYDSLREKGVFYRLDQYSHRYPVCWRCDSELVFRLVDEWFISMDDLRHQIADVTRNIRWIPSFGLERELDWLRNMDDWMISKKRYWGLALPIYKCDCGHFEVIGSEEEMERRAVEGWDEFSGHSPHRPWIDAVKIECAQCGARVSRISDVGNPWLDAGIVSFSTLGYRQDREHWKEWFPADWISESFPGQFRNWFYSLLTMSTALENSEPCKTVFSYALMRDENGDEMHKSKGNAIWFEDAAERMGVDSMRWLYSRHNPALNVSFGFRSADEVRRRFLIPLWNVYSFFVTYANIDEFDPSPPPPVVGTRPELDRWIISELNMLVREVTNALENFEPDRASRAAERFVEYLSNWYVRRSRRRFWKSDADEDKLAAHFTLYECLVTLARLLAPIVPFVSESMYRNLVPESAGGRESVHLEDYPVCDESLIDEELAEATRLAMRLSSLGRAARSKASLKVRQPLARALVLLRTPDEAGRLDTVVAQVRDELNVKNVETIADKSAVMESGVSPIMSKLGPKWGLELRYILAGLKTAEPSMLLERLDEDGSVDVEGYDLLAEEFQVYTNEREGYSVAEEGGYTLAVTTTVSRDLALEGMARELVHQVQNLRREADFDIADHIVAYYQCGDTLGEVLAAHGDYVRRETLSDDLVDAPAPEGAHTATLSVDGEEITLGLVRT